MFPVWQTAAHRQRARLGNNPYGNNTLLHCHALVFKYLYIFSSYQKTETAG